MFGQDLPVFGRTYATMSAKVSLLKIEVVAPESKDAEQSNQALAPENPAPPLQQPKQQRPPTLGTWRYAMEGNCGPDGDYSSNTNIASLITDKAPVGALSER